MNDNNCCFFGHREIIESEKLKSELYKTVAYLIENEGIDTFLFGSKSRFNSLCYETVSAIKEKYPYIKRVYVRSEYPVINESYKNYLLRNYEATYYPDNVVVGGKAVYIKRNFEMINTSRICVVYYDEQNTPPTRKSGTGIALEYAAKRGKRIILLRP